MSAAGGDGDGRLARWSQRKAKRQAGEAVPDEAPDQRPETPGRGGAAPVAGRRQVPVMLPLGDAEEGETGMDAAPPDALELLKRHQAGELPAAAPEKTDEEEMAALTPDERDAIKDLPPVDSLDRDSDFTPFFADNVPEFLKRQAYKALWRSNPFFAFQDGLNDYDEDFSIAKMIAEGIATTGGGKAGAGKAARKAAKSRPEAPPEAGGDDAVADVDEGIGDGEGKDDDVDLTDADDDLGDGEDDDDIV